jgi:prefoldin alpha subunit
MTKEQELSKYLSLIEYYKDQLSSLEMQSQYLQVAIADYHKAKMTLDNLSNIEKGTDMLVPIGGSTFINVAPVDTSKILFDIGFGYIAEKTVDDALKKIDKRIERLQENQEKLISASQQLQTEASELSKKAQELAADMKE